MEMKDIRAVILAGGKGARLRPFTAVLPKPLVPLGNRSIIEILLNQLSASGIVKVTICTGYLAELIQAVCGHGEKWGLEIDYIKEDEPLGTAGPLAHIESSEAPLLVMNGDLLTTLDFGGLVDFHIAEKADFTIGVFTREVKIDFGVIELGENDEFEGYLEKPTYYYDVSMGVNVIGENARQLVDAGQYLDMPDLVLKTHHNKGRVKCCRQACRWLDIGRMDDYGMAQEMFEKGESEFLSPKESKRVV